MPATSRFGTSERFTQFHSFTVSQFYVKQGGRGYVFLVVTGEFFPCRTALISSVVLLPGCIFPTCLNCAPKSGNYLQTGRRSFLWG